MVAVGIPFSIPPAGAIRSFRKADTFFFSVDSLIAVKSSISPATVGASLIACKSLMLNWGIFICQNWGISA
jgi:hypothetical protein